MVMTKIIFILFSSLIQLEKLTFLIEWEEL